MKNPATRLAATFAAFLCAAASASAQQPAAEPGKVEASLVAETETIHPGQSLWAAVELKTAPGWHTYWLNPGDSGEPASIQWRVPDGFRIGALQWPAPEVLRGKAGVDYGYSGETMLLVRVEAPAVLQEGQAVLAADARWLACNEICVPEQATLSLNLKAVHGDEHAVPSVEGSQIKARAAQLPAPAPWSARLAVTPDRLGLTLDGAAAVAGDLAKARFFPAEWGVVDNVGEQKFALAQEALTVDLARGDLKARPLDSLKGLLVLEGKDGRKGYWVEARAEGAPAPQIGKPAPDFTGSGSNGAAIRLGDFKGRTVVLEWTNHRCPYVVKHYGSGAMQALQKWAVAGGAVWLSVISSAPGKEGHVTGPEAAELTASRDAAPTAVLLDPAGAVGRLYRAETTPHMFIIDGSGTLVYMGGIDDRPSTDPATLKGARNHVRQAFEEMMAGKAVSEPVTRPYGCSVKYGQ